LCKVHTAASVLSGGVCTAKLTVSDIGSAWCIGGQAGDAAARGDKPTFLRSCTVDHRRAAWRHECSLAHMCNHLLIDNNVQFTTYQHMPKHIISTLHHTSVFCCRRCPFGSLSHTCMRGRPCITAPPTRCQSPHSLSRNNGRCSALTTLDGKPCQH
jgi:hypothetical protein